MVGAVARERIHARNDRGSAHVRSTAAGKLTADLATYVHNTGISEGRNLRLRYGPFEDLASKLVRTMTPEGGAGAGSLSTAGALNAPE